MIGKRMMMGAGGPKLPYDAEVEYVRLVNSTGYYNTGIFISDNTFEIQCDCKIDAVQTPWMGPFTAYRNEKTEATRLIVYNTNYTSQAFANFRRQANYGYMFNNDWRQRRTYCLSDSLVRTFVDGALEKRVTLDHPSSTVAGGLELRLTGAATDIYYYGFTILHDGESVMDLIPVRKGDVGYLYDRVGGTLIGSWGSVPFDVGPDKTTNMNGGGGHKCLRYSPSLFLRFSRRSAWKEAA